MRRSDIVMTSQGERRCHLQFWRVTARFNPRSPRRLIATAKRKRARLMPFDSRPHEEVDDPSGCLYLGGNLSIHDLTRRSTRLQLPEWNMNTVFQFTTSQGGRPEGELFCRRRRVLSIHDLTRRSTSQQRWIYSIFRLSIHDLTRRSTSGKRSGGRGHILSIHDLTRRSTRRHSAERAF